MAAKKKTYSEKLLDPKWQKKRLLVLNAADWTCQFCSSKDKTLHVHHLRYLKGKNPWDYPTEDLQCLCDSCHREAESARDRLLMTLTHQNIAPALTAFGLMMQDSDQADSLSYVWEPLSFLLTINKADPQRDRIKYIREYISEVSETLYRFLSEYKERLEAEESKTSTPEELDEFFKNLKTTVFPEGS